MLNLLCGLGGMFIGFVTGFFSGLYTQNKED